MKQTRPSIDDSRPFGAHLHMSWWKPLVVILVSAVVLLVLQILGYQLVGVMEGSDDPMSPTLTPLKLLAVNLATIVTGVLAVLLLAWLARVPWRALISSPRGFDPHHSGQPSWWLQGWARWHSSRPTPPGGSPSACPVRRSRCSR